MRTNATSSGPHTAADATSIRPHTLAASSYASRVSYTGLSRAAEALSQLPGNQSVQRRISCPQVP